MNDSRFRKALGIVAASAVLCLAHAAWAKPSVGLWVDGPRADVLQGALYAAVVNSAQLLEQEHVQADLERDVAIPAPDVSLDELAWNQERLAPYFGVAERLGADALVLVRTQQRGKRHLSVSVLVVGPHANEPLLSEVWTITSKNKKKRRGVDAEATFDFAPVRAAVRRLVGELSS